MTCREEGHQLASTKPPSLHRERTFVVLMRATVYF